MNKFLCAEDLRNCRRLPRTLPDRGGEKSATEKSCDRILDDDLGTSQLNYFLNERKSALAEPKVEKLSSLIKGEWLQDERVVRILKNVGNHLEHVGYSEKGNRLLYPEEAIYFMDAKWMVVYYRGLPLSCQEAYNIFFTHPADLLRYQVYSHLSRLGYVVIRHQKRVSLTEYERKIGLHKYSAVRKNKETARCEEQIIKKIKVSQQPLLEVPADDHADSNSQLMDIEIAPSEIQPPMSSHFRPCILARHPDIDVPHVSRNGSYATFAPSPNYLPKNVTCTKKMYIIDMEEINARENMPNLDRREVMDESFEGLAWHERQDTFQQKFLFRNPKTRSFHQKSKVITDAKSWKQYKEELKIANKSNEVQNGFVLGTLTCKPLINFKDASDTLSILHQLQIIKQHKLSDHISSLISLFEFAYDIYLPAVNYNKSKQMIPNYRLLVTSILEPLPRIDQVVQIREYFSDDVPILFAVVDNGDIAFYSFNDVSLPVNVSIG